MPKIPQSQSELQGHLDDHLGFLQMSCDAFDSGHDSEAKRIAVSIRVLAHDTASSHSLFAQLGLLDKKFISTAFPVIDTNQMPHGGLIMVAAEGKETKYVAMLDDVPFTTWLPFKDWWNEVVFVDDEKLQFPQQLNHGCSNASRSNT